MMRFMTAALAAGAFVVAYSPGLALAQGSDNDGDAMRDIAVVQKPLVELTPHEPSSLRVSAWVDHESGVYHLGDDIRISVKTNKDAYVTIIDGGTSGATTVIFPNRSDRDNRVEDGQVMTLPGQRATWSFKLMGPPGVEVIKVIASTSPRPIFHETDTDEAGIYHSFHRRGPEAARDIAVVLDSDHPKQWAEATRVVRVRDNR